MSAFCLKSQRKLITKVDRITIVFTVERKGPSDRPLFPVHLSATVFLVDILVLGDKYVRLLQTLSMHFAEPIRDRKKISQNLKVSL